MVSLLVSGLGIGWLMGLSASPILYSVVTSLLGLVVAVSGALAGVDLELPSHEQEGARPKQRVVLSLVNPLPIVALILGVVAGASVGIYGRTNDWLGPQPGRLIARWEQFGLSRREIATQAFTSLYGKTAVSLKEPREKEDGGSRKGC
jgi:hypothetical protein